ncbi:MAG: CBS domain-containing protein [Armatimonadetes bacterium]|nr:CBS domain-containing protein [Armatimonadota bacterium]
MNASDLMSAPVITVGPEVSVSDVARLMSDKHVGGVPVIDADQRLLGMVTEADLVVRVSGPHVPPHIELLGGVIYLESPREMHEELRKAVAVTAEQIMSANVVTVAPDATVQEVADLMVTRKVNRILVVDDGRLVGMITRHDVVKTLVDAGG